MVFIPLGTPATPPPVGALLGSDGVAWFRACGISRVPLPGVWVKTVAENAPTRSDKPLAAWKDGLSLAVITLSDSASRGEREDKSGPALLDLASNKLKITHAQGVILPDDQLALKGLLVDLALTQRFDLILTSGGTGLGPRDVAPEATQAVIEKRLPGFERAMTMASLAKTPHAAISRAIAGTLGGTLIVNLPGSVKGGLENLEAVLPAIEHAIAKLQGDPAPCGG
jgi:molybdenum cofactor synthesis domain-containing protein